MTSQLDAVDTNGFWSCARDYPTKPAVITSGGIVTTYGDLAAQVNRVSYLFRHLGLIPGDHAAFLLGNQVETYEVALGCSHIGVLFTPINRSLTGRETAYILRDSGARVLVADERYADVALEAARSATVHADACLSAGTIPTFRSLLEATSSYPTTLPKGRVAGGPFYYTSGTTGTVKGVLRSNTLIRSLAESLGAQVSGAEAIGTTGDGVHLVQGPLHHSGPLSASLSALHVGATVIVMQEQWSAEACLALIERYSVTTTVMVPTMFHRLLALPREVAERYDVSSLRNGGVKHGSSMCSVRVKQAMIDWWGPIFRETYGGAEGTFSSVTCEDWITRPGTVGRVNCEDVKVFDDDGNECRPNQIGTIYAHLGEVAYFNAPEKTASSRRGEMFTLGDMGYVDSDGWLFLVDRRVDLIISGGVNIYPAEVEDVMSQHPAVIDVAVIGVPNEEWGHEVKAVVQLADSCEAGDELEAELISFSQERLAKFKCPRSVDFRTELPRDGLGKLQRRRLRQEHK
jgi:long-chain acyl-CoA synthetase